LEVEIPKKTYDKIGKPTLPVRALKTFGEDYPEAGRTLVYRGLKKLKDECLIIYHFLKH
jgi:hypothetical protein